MPPRTPWGRVNRLVTASLAAPSAGSLNGHPCCHPHVGTSPGDGITGVRVPRQLVVDDDVRGLLQVQALAGGVGGEQDRARGPRERGQDLVAAPLRQRPVDAQPPARVEVGVEVVDRVAELGEDDDPLARLRRPEALQPAAEPGQLAVVGRGDPPHLLQQGP